MFVSSSHVVADGATDAKSRLAEPQGFADSRRHDADRRDAGIAGRVRVTGSHRG